MPLTEKDVPSLKAGDKLKCIGKEDGGLTGRHYTLGKEYEVIEIRNSDGINAVVLPCDTPGPCSLIDSIVYFELVQNITEDELYLNNLLEANQS